jgi:spermidine synthase
VLIVGGGDGGSVREALKHEQVREITLVEIDGRVVEVCREYFPALTSGLDDPRVKVRVENGFDFLDRHPASFDVILVDCTDPVPLTEESTTDIARQLFTPRFYHKLKKALRPGGLAAFQSENPFYSGAVLTQMHRELSAEFKLRGLYLANIPTYPGGFWSFTTASDGIDMRRMHADPAPAFLSSLRYFQPDMFPGALVLPRYIERLIAV